MLMKLADNTKLRCVANNLENSIRTQKDLDKAENGDINSK